MQKLQEGQLYREHFEPFADYIEIAKATGYLPADFEIEGVQDGIQQNHQAVIRLRFSRNGRQSGFYDEHFSMVIRKSDKLILGFVDLRTENVVTAKEAKQLPSQHETKQLVKDFFATWQQEYLAQLDDYAYRSRYGENILLDGQKLAIAGTEWKWYAPENGSWGWVVFGKNRKPIIFERDIFWVSGRVTEKWLHDKYLETGSLAFVPVSIQ